MAKMVSEINAERFIQYNTLNNTFKHFPVGTPIKVICVFCNHTFFPDNLEGIVVENKNSYLGIKVKLNRKIIINQDGDKSDTFYFNPRDLVPANRLPEKTPIEDLPKRNLYILVGNIGSGKTTFALEFITFGGKNIVCVSGDSLRYMIGAGKYTYQKAFEPILKQTVLDIIRRFMENRLHIIVDDTHMTKETRKGLLSLAKEFNYDAIAFVFSRQTKRICVDRRMKKPHDIRDRKVWEGVWDKLNNLYETPIIEEGFREIYNVDKR